MKRITIKLSLIYSIALLLVSGCKKADVSPATKDDLSSTGASYTWNGASYSSKQGSGGNNTTHLTLSEKVCGYYYVYSFALTNNGNSQFSSYINLYLPSNGASGTYSVESYQGTTSGIHLGDNKAWLYVYNSTVSGGVSTFNYGYASSGTITVVKNGDAITATFSDLDTYSSTNYTSAFLQGKLSGNIVTSKLDYDLSAYDCNINTTTTGDNPIDTSGSGGNTDTNPLLGTLSFGGVNFPIFNDNFTIASLNGVSYSSATSTTISGGNTISGLFSLVFNYGTAVDISGDYPIQIYTNSGTPDTGKAIFYGLSSDQNYNEVLGYAISGKITIKVVGKKTTITLVDVGLNSEKDGSGNDAGIATGVVSQTQP